MITMDTVGTAMVLAIMDTVMTGTVMTGTVMTGMVAMGTIPMAMDRMGTMLTAISFMLIR
jgi:hypothetical protein